MPTFDPTIVPFLLRYPVDSSFDVPNASPLIANTAYGLQMISTGGNFEVRSYGKLLGLATLNSFGMVISAPNGTIIARTLEAGDSSIIIDNPGGVSGNPSIRVAPETTVQMVNLMANGVAFGTSTPTLNIQSGPNIGIGFDADTNSWIINGSNPGASTNDHIVVTQSASDLPNSFNLGTLASGILKQSVSGSVSTPAIATGNTDYMLVNQNMLDLYNSTPASGSLFYYNGSHWTSIAPGTTGYVWTALSSSTSGWAPSSGGGGGSDWSTFPATQDVDMDGFLINNLGTPIADTDAATKAYVDANVGGAPVGAHYVITQANGSLTNANNLGLLATGLVLSTVSGSVSTLSTTTAPAISGANITSNTIPAASVVGTAGTLSAANAWTGTNTFNSNLPTSTQTPTTSAQLITKVYGDGSYGLIAGSNSWTGSNAFTNFPTCFATPISNSQLVNKLYVDTNFGQLALGNTWSGNNTFNSHLPTSTLTPTLSTQLITKAYGDATYATVAGEVTLGGANAWTGTNTYNTNLPTSTQTPTLSAELITKAYADATYATVAGEVTLDGTNAWTGTNSYDTNLPTSTQTPTTGAQLVTKTYTDTVYGKLDSANDWLGADNIFNTNPLFPSDAVVGYVATCTDDGTGAWTWQAISGSDLLVSDNTWTGTNTFNNDVVIGSGFQISTGASDNYVLTSDSSGNATWEPNVGGAPVDAFYVITQANGSLTNATDLGAGSTGLLVSSVSGGEATVSTIPESTFQPANLTASVTTSDATPTTLISVAVSAGQAITINGLIVAKNSAHTAAVGGSFTATAINIAGTLTLMGTVLSFVNASSSEIFNVIISGTNLIIQVTGIAATTYTWNSSYTTSTL